MSSKLDEFFGPRKNTPYRRPTRTRDALDGVATEPGRKRASKRARNTGEIGERWAFNQLPRVIGASIKKAPTRKIERGGQEFWVSMDTDFVGSVPMVHNRAYRVHIEVKSTYKSFSHDCVSDREAGFLNDARAVGEGALVLLVWFPNLSRPYRQSDVVSADLIPWRLWPDLWEQLAGRASGNFRGRSLRWCDRDLIGDCEIVRRDRVWALCPGHWLSWMLVKSTQEALF